MTLDYKKILHYLFGPLLTVIVFFMRSYKTNRERLDDFLSRKKVTSILQGLAMAVLIIWIIVFYLAPEERRGDLTRQIKQSYDELMNPSENRGASE